LKSIFHPYQQEDIRDYFTGVILPTEARNPVLPDAIELSWLHVPEIMPYKQLTVKSWSAPLIILVYLDMATLAAF